ncbi:50S ribosomal protein L24 [Candidatus Pacearchaeota archaeon]|nr:50S ribosomal protein L24 [Candidatus Pacearchaeota archaeon]
MKSEFSTAWISSKQVRKQRKYRHNAPLHVRHKFLSAHLSKALRQKYGKRSLPLRKGDEVLVMRGSFVTKKAKVASVNTKKSRIALEGIQRSKKDGTKVNVYFDPSVLLIESLVLDDKNRIREKKEEKKQDKKPEKAKHASDKTRN